MTSKELKPKKEFIPSLQSQIKSERLKDGLITERKTTNDFSKIEDLIKNQITDEKESKEIFSSKNIKTKTELSESEIKKISVLLLLTEVHKLNRVENMLLNFMELKVSHKRKSRKEFIDSIKQQQPMFNGGMQIPQNPIFR